MIVRVISPQTLKLLHLICRVRGARLEQLHAIASALTPCAQIPEHKELKELDVGLIIAPFIRLPAVVILLGRRTRGTTMRMNVPDFG